MNHYVYAALDNAMSKQQTIDGLTAELEETRLERDEARGVMKHAVEFALILGQWHDQEGISWPEPGPVADAWERFIGPVLDNQISWSGR